MKPTLSRRECLALGANACAALALNPVFAQSDTVIARPIPSSGERLPVIGLGSAANFWTAKERYAALERCMRTEPLDFIGVDYAVDNRSAEQSLFPIARDRGIAVMVYVPFRQLWDRVAGRDVPPWAADFGAESWGSFS